MWTDTQTENITFPILWIQAVINTLVSLVGYPISGSGGYTISGGGTPSLDGGTRCLGEGTLSLAKGYAILTWLGSFPLWTDTNGKYYLSHPSDAGGNKYLGISGGVPYLYMGRVHYLWWGYPISGGGYPISGWVSYVWEVPHLWMGVPDVWVGVPHPWPRGTPS